MDAIIATRDHDVALLPCPFCGETEQLAIYAQEYNGYYQSAQVECENDDCLASGPMAKSTNKTRGDRSDALLKQQAQEMWNRRAN